jgi:hypothetical protein
MSIVATPSKRPSKSPSKSPSKPLSYKHLRRFVNKVVVDGQGIVEETEHAKSDHPERGLTLWDVELGLAIRWILEEKKFSQKYRTWVYKIKSVSTSGNDMAVIIVPYVNENRIKVVTRW